MGNRRMAHLYRRSEDARPFSAAESRCVALGVVGRLLDSLNDEDVK
jgi:hypothetical protein